jgi:hypothetical protein
MNKRENDLKMAFDFFMNFPDDSARHQEKLTEIKKAPANDFYVRYRGFLDRKFPKAKPRTEITVPKASILEVLGFFESAGCLAIKICFGMDRYQNIHMVVSGSFMVLENQAPQPRYVDRVYRKKVRHRGDSRTQHRYYQNFGRMIGNRALVSVIGSGKAQKMLNRFAGAIEPQKLHGYMMDIFTFRYFLEDSECLGPEKFVKFRFGMNDSGNSAESRSRAHVMMVSIGAMDTAENPCVMYLCDTSIKNDSDPTLCPPREPCNVGGR